MIRLAMGLLAGALAAQPALALSCLRPDVARSFEEARAAEAVYAVVLGRFEFERPRQKGEAATIPAVFDGRVLGAEGFAEEVRRPVRLEVTCAMSWCGEIEPGVETLAFVEQGEEELRVEVLPCPQWVFPAPSAEQIAVAESCMAATCE